MAGFSAPKPPEGDWIADYLRYTSFSEPRKIFHEFVACSTLAAVLQRKCFLPWGYKNLYPNLYVVLVGRSGVRKSTAIDFASEMLKAVGLSTAANTTTRESLISQMKDSAVSIIDPEAMEFEQHCSMTAIASELIVFLKRDNHDFLSLLTDWYDCPDPWEYKTKGSGEYVIPAVYFNLLGATTPQIVQHALPPLSVGGGFTSRVLFVFADRKEKREWLPIPDQETLRIRDTLITRLDKVLSLHGAFEPTLEYLAAYKHWYEWTDENPRFATDPLLEGYETRRATHVRKLSMVFAASEGTFPQLTESAFLRAADLLDRAEEDMSRVFGLYGSARNAELVGRVVETLHDRGELSQKDLMAMLIGTAESVEDVQKVIEMLRLGGKITEKQTLGKTIYTLTPNGKLNGTAVPQREENE